MSDEVFSAVTCECFGAGAYGGTLPRDTKANISLNGSESALRQCARMSRWRSDEPRGLSAKRRAESRSACMRRLVCRDGSEKIYTRDYRS